MQISELEQLLVNLKLCGIAERIDVWLQDAAKQDWDYAEFLFNLLNDELANKQEKRCETSIRTARFPFIKSLNSFDFAYQPSIDAKQMKELAKARFVANGDNLVFLGPPGVGKTHLAVALGIEAIKQGYKTLFTTAQALLASLAKAHSENRLEEKLKYVCQPKLLIIDEIGYIPFDRQGANLFFQLIAKRYEKGSLILTSNQAFTNWGDVFGDRVIATAILDRILHHSVTVNIKGESYRLKEKLKSGLVRKANEQ